MPKVIHHDVLSGGGESGALMRDVDWASTALGPVDTWPQSLRTALGILLDNSFGMAIAWGPDYTFFYNDAYRPILGSTKHPAAMGRPIAAIFPEIWHIIGPMFDDVMRGKTFGWDDWRLPLDRHGFTEECFFTFSYSPIRAESGGVGGVLVTVAEITARVLGERRMRILRDIAAQTAEAQSDDEACRVAALVLDQATWDVPFAHIYLFDDNVPRLVAHCGDEWKAGDLPRPDRQDCLSSTLLSVDVLHHDDFGETVVREAFVLPIARHGDSHPAGMLVAGISPRLKFDDRYRDFLTLLANQIATAVAKGRAYREAQARADALAELDRAKTAFFSNVSHEFRTPLTLLLGPLEEVLRHDGVAAEDRESLEVVHRNALRLLKLVNALLDFSRIEAGRIEASYEPADLGTLTSDLAALFRSAIENAGLRFTVRADPISEPVYVDREMWEKIVLNLLSNALKFTFEGSIEVTLQQIGREVELRVRDTGAGIPAAELPNMFKRFHRVRGPRSRTHEGTGIGLALVHELTRLHGGSVAVESRENEGSTFSVRIPLGTAHLPAERIVGQAALRGALSPLTGLELNLSPGKGRTPEARPVEGRTILVIDDNADMRDYLSHILDDFWQVETATNGLEAFDKIRARKPDVILSDVMMPGLDGFELLKWIRADVALREIPVILLSARAGEEARVEGLEAGADDYLIKPFSANEVIARVRSHLRLAELRKHILEQYQHLAHELDVANRAKDEFLTTLSHELRTPMTATLGWATMLRITDYDETARKQAIDAIEQSTRAQAKLIDDILDVSRISTGKLKLNLEPVSLEQIVDIVASTFRQIAESKQVTIETDIEKLRGSVVGDADRLGQIVRNLLSNAVKFTGPGGRIRITLDQTETGHARIRVIDTGEGIAPDFLPHVFERFRQENGWARTHGGLGIGLSIVKDLTELHAGAVSATSEGPGTGATFTIMLPIVQLDAASTDAAPLKNVVALDGIPVLVVEDDEATRTMLRTALTRFGATVSTASSVNEAVAMLANDGRSVVVSDIAMPGEDGYSLIAKLRARGDDVRNPIIALTANARTVDRERVLAAGFDAFLAKPVDLNVLADEVRRLVHKQ
ncbi:MAG TPA: ATP-binding protein [Thermoanaerobaculia bacterium]|nr:ATP-binding protein [Thermoanaerobaculia bacterium]